MLKRVFGIMLVMAVALVFLPGCKRNAEMKHKFRKEMAMERLDMLAATLDLSEEQQVKFDEIKKDLVEKMDNNKKDREAFREEMLAELEKDNPDINLVADKAKKKIDEGSAKLKDGIDTIVAFYDMLNEDQQAALIDKVQKKIDALQVLQE